MTVLAQSAKKTDKKVGVGGFCDMIRGFIMADPTSKENWEWFPGEAVSLWKQVWMCISMKNAIELNDDKESAKHLRVQRDLGATLDSLIHALSTLQRQRLALEPPPPPATKAKVIPISKGARPKKVELEPEPVPNVQPFTSGQGRTKERGASPSLDFKIAA
jgi:hypothetical protein